MAQIDVKDAAGVTQTVAMVENTGQALAADSLPVVLPAAQISALTPLTGGATEATLGDIETVLGATGDAAATAGSTGTVSAKLRFATTQLGSIAAGLPTAKGTLADSASTSVAFSTEGKAQLGSLTETAPASDTASSGINGRLQRIAQRLSSLIALTPALGTTTDSASSPVAFSTEGKAQLGDLTETAPASDTASSGINGRLQRLAQRLTSLIALLPASLGIKTAAGSLSVAPASDATFTLTTSGVGARVTVTRPANTTAYSAGDVVGGAITFPTMGDLGGHTVVNAFDLIIPASTGPVGTSFRLHIYSVTPPSAIADNAAWDLPSGDRASYRGFIDLGVTSLAGSSSIFGQAEQNRQVRLDAADTALYAYLVTNSAYTPAANSEGYIFVLRGYKL